MFDFAGEEWSSLWISSKNRCTSILLQKNLHYYYVLLPTGETFSTTEQEAGTGDQSMIKLLLLLLPTQPHFSSVIAYYLIIVEKYRSLIHRT
jgi:hypothetical protein